jgi:predicted nucleic acid-binding protein
MLVVSDTSPIINLAAAGQLGLLRQLYGKIVIPQAVHDEIVVAGRGQPVGQEIGALSWIETWDATNSLVIALLMREVERGEAETLALGIEAKASLLLLDERKGRNLAAYLGLPFTGVLDILSEAKRKQIIPEVKPLLDEIIARARFRVSKKLYRRVLEAAGE